MRLGLFVMLGLIVCLIFFRNQIGWILLGLLFSLWWLWKTFWRIVALPFRLIVWIPQQIYWQWETSEPSIFIAKTFTVLVVLALAIKAFFLFVK